MMLWDFDIEIRWMYYGLRDTLLNNPIPQFRTTDGDELIFYISCYEFKSSVKEVLLAHEPLTLISDINKLLEEYFTANGKIKESFEIAWLNRQLDQVVDQKGSHTVLGWFRFKKHALIVETNSKERGEKILELIESLLGDMVELKDSFLENLEQKFMDSDANPLLGLLKRSDIQSSFPESAEPYLQVRVKQNWEKWFDTPISAL